MSWPNFKLELGFGSSAPFTAIAATVWTDVSSRLKAAQWSHERQRELDQATVAQSQVVVDNSDRAFESLYSGSPYYPNVRPDIKLRLSVSVGGGAYTPLFVHYIDDILVPWTNQTDDTCAIIGQDAFSIFQLVDVFGLYSINTVANRLGALLDGAGWPAADRNITTGGTQLPQITYAGGNNFLLPIMQLVSDSRPGTLFMNNAGQVASIGYSSGSLPSTLGLGGVDFDGAHIRVPRSACYNAISLSCTSPALTGSATDSASIAEHGRRVLQRSVIASGQTDINTIATALMNRYRYPKETFDQIRLLPKTDAGYSLLATVDIGVGGTLARHSDTGDDYSHSIILNAFSHNIDIGNQTWECVLRAVARSVT